MLETARQYLSNGLICAREKQAAREESVAEPKAPGSVSKALNAASKTVESYVYPLLVFSQSVPKIAIAPLFVVWFGFGIIPKVISAFLLGFFRVFCAVNLPHAMPAIFSGLKVSITLAVVGAVVGEFVGSNSGIGYVLQRSIGTF